MADEKKEQPATAPVTTVEAPVMTQGKPGETKASMSVDPNAGKPAAGGGSSSPLTDMLPMLVGMMLIFYFLLIRPEKKRREAQMAVLTAMKKDDKVVLTAIGLYGTVAAIDGDDVTLIIDPKKDVRIKVKKEAIGTIVEPQGKK